jgi:predicted dehydrogenase
MSDPVGWAVVGSSEFALDYVVPAVASQRGCAVRAVVTRRPGQLRDRLAADGIAVTDRLGDLPGLGVDVAHLVVPNDLHLDLTLECLALGRHVLVEKPMALTAGEARQMAAAAAGRLLAVGSCMAWSPTITRAAELLAAGALGNVMHGEISVGFDTEDQRGWRQLTPTSGGGGVLYDLGAHAIDAMIRLFGDVAEVNASLRTNLPRHVSDDTASLMLVHRTGITSHLELAFTHGCNQLSVTGTGGHLTSDEWLGRRFVGDLVLRTGQPDAKRFGRGQEREGVTDELRGAPVVDVLALQAGEIAAAIRHGAPAPHADIGTALQVMAVIDAAVESSAGKRAVCPST